MFVTCSGGELKTTAVNDNPQPSNPSFNDYWYSGNAEIASYSLEQSRYGELHSGNAVLIFVTEDFSKLKQVKLDYPSKNEEDKVSVLKLNFTKKFNTGIYPYSMMLSTFTPVESSRYPNALKTTMSSQEWCGHVFSQMNLGDDHYDLSSYSYFESEGDTEIEAPAIILEDEIWSRIRLDYKSLPTGDFEMLPGLFHTRLLHKSYQSTKVNGSLAERENDFVYTLTFGQSERTLVISFEKVFPYKITGWKETSKGLGGKELTTIATLKKTLHTDYWNKNKNKHRHLRDSLGL